MATLPAAGIQILSRDEYKNYETVANIIFSDNTYTQNNYNLDLTGTITQKMTSYTLQNPTGAVSIITVYFTGEESASPPSTRDYESSFAQKIIVTMKNENINNNVNSLGGSFFNLGPFESTISQLQIDSNNMVQTASPYLPNSYFCYSNPLAARDPTVHPIIFATINMNGNQGRFLYSDSTLFTFGLSNFIVQTHTTTSEFLRAQNVPTVTFAYSKFKDCSSTSSSGLLAAVNVPIAVFSIITAVNVDSGLVFTDSCPAVQVLNCRGRDSNLPNTGLFYFLRSTVSFDLGDFRRIVSQNNGGIIHT